MQTDCPVTFAWGTDEGFFVYLSAAISLLDF